MTEPTTTFERHPNGMSMRKVIKAKDVPKTDEEYIERHELSLLSLLAHKYPTRAIDFAKKSLLTSETP